jgi:hypothetical protein
MSTQRSKYRRLKSNGSYRDTSNGKEDRLRNNLLITDLTLQRFMEDLDEDDEDSSNTSGEDADAGKYTQIRAEREQTLEPATQSQQLRLQEPQAEPHVTTGPILDQILVFDNAMHTQRPRGRRKYSPQEKQRVNELRQRGACRRCANSKKRVRQAGYCNLK